MSGEAVELKRLQAELAELKMQNASKKSGGLVCERKRDRCWQQKAYAMIDVSATCKLGSCANRKVARLGSYQCFRPKAEPYSAWR